MPAKQSGTESTLALGATLTAPPTPSSEPAGGHASTPVRHTLAGRYEILGLVGSGGMGTVYRARDAELDEVVALKMLRRDVLDSPGILDRFRQEVRLARRVTHRNVARTYDIGESDGEKFITMEFVEGESLAARLGREGPLPLATLVPVALGICAGLEAAHAAGIVHRDLKPDNVLLERSGRVVLTDFGVARALSGAAQAVTVGLALGTPAYMAPEQVEGADDLDARADLYALGAMLYECIVGERAWSGDSIWATVAARLVRPPPDPRVVRPDVPTSVAQLILRCMARRREERFGSASEIASALSTLTLPAAVTRPSSPPPAIGLPDPDAKTVAVLPLRNLGSPDDAYLADGLFDDLVDALSMTQGVKVLARGAVARVPGADRADRDAREIGRELRVAVVVDGTVRRAGDTLRIAARVISVADGFQLWAKRFDRPEKDVLSVSDDLANAVAEALTVKRSAPVRSAPSDPRAVALYLRARHALHRGWRDDVGEAIGLFEQALALAPDDPMALSGYARAQLRRFMFDTEASGAEVAERLAREAAERALSRSPASGEARAALAQLAWTMGDHVRCARDLREALLVAPGSPDVGELWGRLLLEVGEPERAVTVLSAASAADPTVDLMTGDLMRARVLCGDWSAYEAAMEQPSNDDSRGSPRWFLLARLTTWRRDPILARTFRQSVTRAKFDIRGEVLRILDLFEPGAPAQEIQAGLDAWGRVAGRALRRPIFFRQLAAELAAFVGNREGALHAIEQADAVGLLDVTWADRCPLLGDLRDEPRFRAVRERVAGRAREARDALEGRDPA